MTPELALEIALDALREAGLDQQAQYLEQHALVSAYVRNAATVQNEYADAWCTACGSTDLEHDENCFTLHFWKLMGDPRYQESEDVRLARVAEQARRTREREEYERLRCTARGETRCRLLEGHGGVHDFPQTLTSSLNEMMKRARQQQGIADPPLLVNPRDFNQLQQMQNESLFGLDRDAPASAFSGVRVETSPYLKEGHAIIYQAPPVVPDREAFTRAVIGEVDAREADFQRALAVYMPQPQRMMRCPHCESTSLTPLPTSQMLTCDLCRRTSSYERCL